ncbi:helix-turn-helix domain-containing protein [Metabacillus arenae]|uniref:Helix-turn-helix transcriptional regulator n=1 Tax=Metabacillus arenae TaxID=2771434 RepID=A0A926NDE0_9BACI|nr:helix-turn-helix transcriptional regulator [Metabacillus arenae]MBD1379181.1 helix-turn-helix transcriptional regulator [Metabacillus arenae]
MSGLEFKIKRIMLNIQAKEIADRLQVSKAYISLMESGKRAIPSDIHEKWADVLGLQK